MEYGRVGTQSLPKCPWIVGSWMRILVPIDTDHGGKLGCLVSSSTRRFRIMTRDSMLTFKGFNGIGMHYWSTNFIKSWYEMMPPSNSIFHLSSYCSLESRYLTTYKSLEYLSIWCEIKYSYESYLWMVNWFDNPPLSRLRKEKTYGVVFWVTTYKLQFTMHWAIFARFEPNLVQCRVCKFSDQGFTQC